MTFNHFEKAVTDPKNMEKFFEVFENLKDPTKTMLGYTLDISSYLNTNLLGDNYVMFGGYAILSHLMKLFGEDFAKYWRGSSDVDMAGNIDVLNAIRMGYSVKSDFLSPNLANKRTIKIIEDKEKECKVDLYMGNFYSRFQPIEENTHFGIDVKVANPLSLIRGKLYTPEEQEAHACDIMTMLRVLESRNYTPEQIIRYFSPKQRTNLYVRMRLGTAAIGDERLDAFPSGQFRGELEKLLHQLRPVK